MSEQLTNDQKIKIMELAISIPESYKENYQDKYKKMVDLIVNYKAKSEDN